MDLIHVYVGRWPGMHLGEHSWPSAQLTWVIDWPLPSLALGMSFYHYESNILTLL